MLTLRIREILPATPRARIVRLDLDRHHLVYRAGQAVRVANHGDARRRPYSLAAAPADAARDGWLELLVGLKASGDPGSHLTLEPGQLVDVEGPLGRFTFPEHPAERRFVFVAGGTGIAPLRAMLHVALEQHDAAIGLLYSARTPGEFAYEDEWRDLAAHGRIELRQTVTRGGGTGWRGQRGRIGRTDLEGLVHDPDTLCFICGPPALVDEIPRMLEELGVAPGRIRIEEWG